MTIKQSNTRHSDRSAMAHETPRISIEQWERQRELIAGVRQSLLELKDQGYEDLTESLIDDLGWVLEDEHRRIGVRMGFSESPPVAAPVEPSPTPEPEPPAVGLAAVRPRTAPVWETGPDNDPALEWLKDIFQQPPRPPGSVHRKRRPPTGIDG